MITLMLMLMTQATPPSCLTRTTVISIGGGQSNWSGRGRLTELVAGFPANAALLTTFTNGWVFERSREPVDSRPYIDTWFDETAEVGPHLAFADEIAAHRCVQVVLVPCARGGSTVVEWTPSRQRNRLYGSCLDRVLYAMVRFPGAHVTLGWYQGESDAVDPARAATWASLTQAVFDAFRRDLDRPDMPIVFVQLSPTSPGAAYPGWNDIRTVQENLQRRDQVMVPAPDGPRRDTVHLGTAAQMTLGRALGAAWLSMTNTGGAG